jgi:hypothetical protein
MADLRDARVLTAEAWHQERGTATAASAWLCTTTKLPATRGVAPAPPLATTGAHVHPRGGVGGGW